MMKDKDILQRFLFENASVRGELVHLEQSYQTIVEQHAYPPMICRLLGEALVVACLLSATIKFKGRLSVQFQGKGKLKLLLVQCDEAFHLRGVVRWDGELNENELDAVFKEGILAIIMDPTEGGQRYQGIVEWQGHSLAKSIEAYFKQSEQLPTRIWLAVDDHQAAGMLLQIIPNEGDNSFEEMANGHDWDHLTQLASTIKPEELLNLQHETVLHRLFNQEDVRLFHTEPVTFQCGCTVERGENAILFLGRDEVEEELRDKQKIVVTCDFCNKEYVFDRVDVEAIFKKGGQSSSQVH